MNEKGGLRERMDKREGKRERYACEKGCAWTHKDHVLGLKEIHSLEEISRLHSICLASPEEVADVLHLFGNIEMK